MRERDYQAQLIKTLHSLFPGSLILKNDAGLLQGIPDLLILYKTKWAALEVKASARSPHQPNQEFYIRELDQMSYARFIFPENEEEVLRGIQQIFEPYRPANFPNS